MVGGRWSEVGGGLSVVREWRGEGRGEGEGRRGGAGTFGSSVCSRMVQASVSNVLKVLEGINFF